MAEDEWLDADAAARELGLPVRLIYDMVKAHQLPAVRFPVRIRRQDIDACLELCRIQAGVLAHEDPDVRRRTR